MLLATDSRDVSGAVPAPFSPSESPNPSSCLEVKGLLWVPTPAPPTCCGWRLGRTWSTMAPLSPNRLPESLLLPSEKGERVDMGESLSPPRPPSPPPLLAPGPPALAVELSW